MTNRFESPQPDRLDAYLDGQMSELEREALEKTLEADAGLRDQVETQGNLDRTLRRLFEPTAPSEELIASLQRTPEQSGVAIPLSVDGGKHWLTVRVVSAAAAICLVGAWVTWTILNPSDPAPSKYVIRPPAEVYQESVEQGFEPLWVCEDDRQFASTFLARQGQGLMLRPLPEGTQMVGLSYLNTVSGNTTTLMARVDGVPVMVFVARINRHRAPPRPDDASGLNLFRKRLAGVALYELTPLESPRVMEFLYPVEVPDPVDIPDAEF